MQGTVVMLMALSGLGCHNKCYDVVYAPPTYGCFGGGCYANVYPTYVAPSSFTGCYAGGYSGCYSGCYGGGCYGGGWGSCYSACYGGGYWGGHHGCGLLSMLFSCCGWGRHGGWGYGYGGYGGYGYDGGFGGYGAYGTSYDPAVFGYALQYNYGAPVVGDTVPSSTPSEAVTPVPPSPTTDMPAATPPKPGIPAPDTTLPAPPPRPTPAVPLPTPPKPNT
jgi:hypothetical protein